MKLVSYYDLVTGRIIASSVCSEEEAVANLPAGCAAIDGMYNGNEYYVENGAVVPMPPSPGDFWQFNFNTKQWENHKTPEIEGNIVRDKRLLLLAQSDWTDTVSAQTRLGATLYQAWQDYRQALRDIPAQAGYPFNVTWPNAPSN
jgi:hypothetical protein